MERELETGRPLRTVIQRDGVTPNTVADLNYGYDDSGNITKVADTPAGGAADTQCFTYDQLRRLTEAWTPDSRNCTTTRSTAALGGPAPYWQSWTYDPAGRRQTQTSRTPSATSSTSYRYPTGAQRPDALTSTTTEVGGTTTTAGYDYDAAGHDERGQQVTQRRETPFGTARGTATAWPNEKGFVGGTVDPTGLTHLGAREYDPAIGRFISVDPMIDFGRPQQLNGYGYADNDPIDSSDASGMSPEDAQWEYNHPNAANAAAEDLGWDKYGKPSSWWVPFVWDDQDDPGETVTVLPNGTRVATNESGETIVNGYVLPDGAEAWRIANQVDRNRGRGNWYQNRGRDPMSHLYAAIMDVKLACFELGKTCQGEFWNSTESDLDVVLSTILAARRGKPKNPYQQFVIDMAMGGRGRVIAFSGSRWLRR